tara:strand:- start:269 stop:940 length:672 start_codon:yes stop_codon:yes gene_type:complete
MALPKRFPFSLIPRYKKITKLSKSPISSIRKWLYERDKTKVIDPLKRKTKRIKDKKINVGNLQELSIQFAEKIDELVDLIGINADLEQMIIAEVELRTDSDIFLENEIQKREIESIKRDNELEVKSAEDDLELEKRLEELIYAIEAVLSRRLDVIEEELEIHSAQQVLDESTQDLKIGRLQMHRHRMGISPAYTWRPTRFKKGGKTSEKEKLIQEILELQNKS